MRLTRLTPMDVCVAQKWLIGIEEAMLQAQAGALRPWDEMLVLGEKGEVGLKKDERWTGEDKQLREAERAVRGFVEEVPERK